MAEKIYSIVIPTRERHDVLQYSLQTALALPQKNVEIIVMDNCSSPETLDVVRRHDDPRVRYHRSDERLSMSENWELGLSKVTGDYVFFLGDDDGIMPDAIQLAMRIHNWYPDKILAWKPIVWMWPTTIVEPYRNVLHMHISKKVELRDSKESLRKLYSYENNFHESPGVYNAIVPMTFMRGFIGKHGKYFFSPVPDIYSGIVNSYFTDSHVYSYRPLSVWGLSKHSTGVSYSFSHLASSSVDQFHNENRKLWDAPVDEKLVPSRLTEVIMADTKIKTKQYFFPDDASVELNMAGVVRSMCEAATRYTSGTDEIVLEIQAVAEKNAVPSNSFKIPAEFPGPQTLVNNYSMDAERDLISFSCYTDEKLYPTVDKLVQHVTSMSVNVDSLYVQDNTHLGLNQPAQSKEPDKSAAGKSTDSETRKVTNSETRKSTNSETRKITDSETRKSLFKTVSDLIKPKS
ncbi:MAG TPA: glycosyltransferase family A protein [Drouetiella sp.]